MKISRIKPLAARVGVLGVGHRTYWDQFEGLLDELNRKLDVFIRDLDPRYPYRREIAYRSAKQGFRLGGVRFELISAGRAKAKLVWIRKG